MIRRECSTVGRRIVIAVLLAGVGTQAHAASPPAGSVGTVIGGPPCNSSFDPYDFAPSALASCGFHVFPRTQVAVLSDGGMQ
jgi:hypothetical protein